MANRRFSFRDRLTVADLLLASSGISSLFVLGYFLYYYSWTGQRQFSSPSGIILYYILTPVLAAFFFASLKLKPRYRITIGVFWLSLLITAFGAEISLRYVRAKRPNISTTELVRLATQSGVNFDTREMPQVIADLRSRGIDAIPQLVLTTVQPRVDRNPGPGTPEPVPLAGMSHKVTVVCNETGKYLIYKSDKHGFHNPTGAWNPNRLDVVAVGNSFTMGYCLPSDQNFVSLIQRRYPATLNLGMAGEGPLRILAALTEYAASRKPRRVLWFYSELHSVYELGSEKQNRVLLDYLDPGFNQALMQRQRDIDTAVKEDLKRQTAAELENRKRRNQNGGARISKFLEFMKLPTLRQSLRLVSGTTEQERQAVANFDANINLLGHILPVVKNRVAKWGGLLYFVYLPGGHTYTDDVDRSEFERARVLHLVKTQGIPLLDMDRVVRAERDPLGLFPFRTAEHYNEAGHRVVAEHVLDWLDRNPPSRSG